ncbi:Toxin Afp18 [Pandoraea terrae]|uniref:Toxin Afp18 n=1 Tax=Pandoraea terrae TaxID=1537710 RepID=A0A5E4T9S7_9BURK|nr:DUF6543 domain-containing protein [Pandoraea terrae]VVD84860.1 Toxin Afp18 [Pandoraea terrae]
MSIEAFGGTLRPQGLWQGETVVQEASHAESAPRVAAGDERGTVGPDTDADTGPSAVPDAGTSQMIAWAQARTKRDLPGGSGAADMVRRVAGHPMVPGFLGTSAAGRRMADVVAAQTAREADHLALRAMFRQVPDVREHFRRQLSADLARRAHMTGASFDSDAIFLNRFKFFRRVWRSELGAYMDERHGITTSINLTDLAMAMSSDPGAVPAAATMEYGLYRRNTGAKSYFSDEEVQGLSASDAMKLICEQNYKESYRNAVADVWESVESGRFDKRAEIVERLARMALNEAKLQYEAGQISVDGLRLAQVVLQDRDAQSRAQSDANVDGIDTYLLEYALPDASVFEAAATFIISAPPFGESLRGGRTLVYMVGSPTPFREYASLDILMETLLPSDAGQAYRAWRDRLPLRAHEREQQPFLLKKVEADIVSAMVAATLETIDDDIVFAGPQRAVAQRMGDWRRWWAGATGYQLGRGLESAPSDVTEGGYLGASERLHVPLQSVYGLTSLTEARGRISAAMPDLVGEASKYARLLLTDRFNLTLSPDETWFNTFRPTQDVLAAAIGGVHRIPGNQLESSMTLTDMVVREVTGQPVDIGAVSLTSGIYTEGIGAALFCERNAAGLKPLDFQRAIDIDTFRTTFLVRVEAFWRQHAGDIRRVLQSTYIVDAFLHHKSGTISDRGAALARRVTGRNDAMHLTLHDISDTEPAPVRDARLSWLAIGGHVSNMLLIAGEAGEPMLLYAPLSNPAGLYEFADVRQRDAWVCAQVSDPEKRRVFAGAFSGAAHRKEAVQDLNAIFDALTAGSRRAVDVVKSGMTVEGDPFDAMAAQMKANLDAGAGELVSVGSPAMVSLLTALRWINDVFGIASIAVPAYTPVSFGLAGLEFSLGLLYKDSRDPGLRENALTALYDAFATVIGVSVAGMARCTHGAWRSYYVDHLAPYECSVAVSGMEQVGPNLYRYRGHFYAKAGDSLYGVDYDVKEQTWRLSDPSNKLPDGKPLRQNGIWKWELRRDDAVVREVVDELFDAPDAAIFDRLVNTEYRRRRISLERSPVAQRREAFRQGVEEARMTPPVVGRPSAMLKLDFVDPKINDGKLLGILSQRIDEAERAERAAKSLRAADIVARDFAALGGRFDPLPQAVYLAANGDGHTGFCLPLSRAMAVALHQGEEAALMARISRAATSPNSPDAVALKRSLVALHSNVAAYRASHTEPMTIALDKVYGLIRTMPRSFAYLVSTRAHSMLVGVQNGAAGELAFYFYDANFGLARFPSVDTLQAALERHLIERNLAGDYEAYGVETRPSFAVTPIDLDILAAVRAGDTTVGALFESVATDIV